MSKFVAVCLVGVGTLLVLTSLPVIAGDGEDKQASKLAVAFLKAVREKDLASILRHSGTPWLDPYEERVIKDGAELRRSWEDRLPFLNPSRIPEAKEVASVAFSEFRMPPAKSGDDEFDAFVREQHESVVRDLDRVLAPTDRIVTAWDKFSHEGRVVFVRSRDGRAEIVGGPIGLGYLRCANRIPRRARELLEKAQRFELFSIEPRRSEEKPADEFHGWEILGRTEIAPGMDRNRIVISLKQSVEEGGDAFAGCFNPRHAIRVTVDGKTADLAICFECNSILVYFDEDADSQVQISDSAQSTFDDILRAAKVPLAEKAKR